MKKPLVLALLFSSLLGASAFAEPYERGRRFEQLIDQLELEPGQVDEVKQIMQDQREKRRAIFQEIRAQAKPKMEALHEETKERLSGVLNDAQMARFEEIAADMRARHEQRMQRFQGKDGFPD